MGFSKIWQLLIQTFWQHCFSFNKIIKARVLTRAWVWWRFFHPTSTFILLSFRRHLSPHYHFQTQPVRFFRKEKSFKSFLQVFEGRLTPNNSSRPFNSQLRCELFKGFVQSSAASKERDHCN